MKLGKNNSVTFKLSWYFLNFSGENGLILFYIRNRIDWLTGYFLTIQRSILDLQIISKIFAPISFSTEKFGTNSLSCFQVKTMGFEVVPGQDGSNGKVGKRVEIVWKLPVGTYSDGNLFVVYDMSRHVLPTAPSPTTTHLIVCIFTFL